MLNKKNSGEIITIIFLVMFLIFSITTANNSLTCSDNNNCVAFSID